MMSIGVSKAEFDDSTPNDLQPYIKAQEFREKRIDAQQWSMGIYVLNAVSVAVSRCLAGRKSRAKYLDKTLLELAKEEKQNEALTDADKFEEWVSAFNVNFRHSGSD